MKVTITTAIVAMAIFCSPVHAAGYGTIAAKGAFACVGLGFYEYLDLVHDMLEDRLTAEDARLRKCILVPAGTEVEVLSKGPIEVDPRLPLLQIRVPGDYVEGNPLLRLRYIRVTLAASVNQ